MKEGTRDGKGVIENPLRRLNIAACRGEDLDFCRRDIGFRGREKHVQDPSIHRSLIFRARYIYALFSRVSLEIGSGETVGQSVGHSLIHLGRKDSG